MLVDLRASLLLYTDMHKGVSDSRGGHALEYCLGIVSSTAIATVYDRRKPVKCPSPTLHQTRARLDNVCSISK